MATSDSSAALRLRSLDGSGDMVCLFSVLLVLDASCSWFDLLFCAERMERSLVFLCLQARGCVELVCVERVLLGSANCELAWIWIQAVRENLNGYWRVWCVAHEYVTSIASSQKPQNHHAS
jgi:hypothetical protein